MNHKDVMAMTEEQLYEHLWNTEYTPSACALPLAAYVARHASKDVAILDIGCGDGTTVQLLRAAGFSAYGVDLTMAGVNKRFKDSKVPDYFVKASVTNMGVFLDNAFDFTFSTDCLEHLPPVHVGLAIDEILRITKRQTFHSMPIWGDDRLGKDVHLSKHPMEWWREQFMARNRKGIDVKIQEREEFLQEMKHDI